MKYVYPVVFSPEEEGGYCVYAPAFPGCVTEAESWAEGIDKIREGLCGMLMIHERDHLAIPAPGDPLLIAREPNDVVTLVDADTDDYRRRVGVRAVRRTISIPAWMDDAATQAGVSLSQVTQDALRQQLRL
ncbi:MAG: type II toxin-antitoxin system HicB family antitoxin [Oscillospiraceae bacterium]|jgi:predicted RNase H-like HicB family nuclease|nr:type II toxin-antitoxin system HicB family antitoxin [Oscillospiraceae bacterium]